MLQSYVFLKSFTSQNIAPYRGGGESQTRYRFLVPPLHVVLHFVHSLHGPHPPRSDSEIHSKYKKPIIFGIIQRLNLYFIIAAHLGPPPEKKRWKQLSTE